MFLYLIISAFMFLVLFAAWKKDIWINLFIKLTLFALSSAGFFFAAQVAGYVVKVK